MTLKLDQLKLIIKNRQIFDKSKEVLWYEKWVKNQYLEKKNVMRTWFLRVLTDAFH